jgi:hypothetical protein
MGFNLKNVVIGNQPQPSPEQSLSSAPSSNSPELELEELQFLLKMLGNADLKGHQVEMFYNMIIKLQNLYLQKSK